MIPIGLLAGLGSGGPNPGGFLEMPNKILGTFTSVASTAGKVVGFVSSLFGGGGDKFKKLAKIVEGNGDFPLVIFNQHQTMEKSGGQIVVTEPLNKPYIGSDYNDQITSIFVAPGVRIDYYKHAHYKGNHDALFGSSNKALKGKASNALQNNGLVNLYKFDRFWDDEISSYKVSIENATEFNNYKNEYMKSYAQSTSGNSDLNLNTSNQKFQVDPSLNTSNLDASNASNLTTANLQNSVPKSDTEKNNTMLMVLLGAAALLFIFKKKLRL